MTVAILDTTVIIHIFRRYKPAVEWFTQQDVYFSVTSITWMEVMVGVANKRAQTSLSDLLDGFTTELISSADQQWAMQQIYALRFSHGVKMADCLIASVAHRLQLPLYTHNINDFKPMIGELAVRPYS